MGVIAAAESLRITMASLSDWPSRKPLPESFSANLITLIPVVGEKEPPELEGKDASVLAVTYCAEAF